MKVARALLCVAGALSILLAIVANNLMPSVPIALALIVLGIVCGKPTDKPQVTPSPNYRKEDSA